MGVKLFPSHLTLDDKIQHFIVLLLRISLVSAVVLSFTLRSWEIVFISVVALGLSYLPSLIERNYKVDLPVEFEIVIVLFIYGAIFLGEVGNFYETFTWWDTLLHTASGIVLGFTGFLLLYLLYYQKKLNIGPFGLVAFAFCFALASGVMWEIFEFVMDQLFSLNMQKNGLEDTMWDLIVDGLGALGVSVAGYFYIKTDRQGFLAKFITSFLNKNPQISGRLGRLGKK